ncbi:MAG: glycosyltransferase family 87 protein [Hyphomicrobiaceae bacterium]
MDKEVALPRTSSEGVSAAARSVSSCARCLLAVLMIVLGSVLVAGVADHILWSKKGYEPSAYNGSTLRTLREIARPGDSLADSWRPMSEALRVLRSSDGNRLYEKLFFEDRIKFQYPPTSLIYIAALEMLGMTSPDALDAITAVVFAVGCAAFAYLILFLLQPSICHASAQQWMLALLLTLAALLYYPSVQALKLGQIQVWINTLFVFACIAWLRGAKATAGALLALAATIKPQLGIFLAWAVLWREWSFLRGFLAAGLPIGMISLLAFGLHNHFAYLEVLSFLSRHGEAYFANQSVNGLVHRALGNGINLRSDNTLFAPMDARVIAATSVSSLALLAIALAPARAAGQRRPDIVDMGIMSICATLASPIAWEHHYGVLLPLLGIAGVLLCGSLVHRAALVTLAASWVLSANYLPATNYLSDTWLNFMQSYLLFAALLLLGVFIYLRRQFPSGHPGRHS